MDTVNYQNWSEFGQSPSMNFNWNLCLSYSDMPTTPFFFEGIYKQYYCLLDTTLYFLKGWKLNG